MVGILTEQSYEFIMKTFILPFNIAYAHSSGFRTGLSHGSSPDHPKMNPHLPQELTEETGLWDQDKSGF